MNTRVSFSGAQLGMNEVQRGLLRALLIHLNDEREIGTGVHGDCVGADNQFHDEMVDLFPDALIEIHPGMDQYGKSPSRAWCRHKNLFVHQVRPYLERNRHIVDAGHLLIATPNTEDQLLRSGTWSTVRYAYRTKKLVYLILPSGKMTIQ